LIGEHVSRDWYGVDGAGAAAFGETCGTLDATQRAGEDREPILGQVKVFAYQRRLAFSTFRYWMIEMPPVTAATTNNRCMNPPNIESVTIARNHNISDAMNINISTLPPHP
jgi:hypothetical protein